MRTVATQKPSNTASRVKNVDEIVSNALSMHRKQLLNHRIYSSIKTVQDTQVFMESHVFAVWDFMSLLKTLQRRITCTNVPWTPVQNEKSARLVNEIVLGEESDIVGYFGKNRTPVICSHYNLYLHAMRELGASTVKIEEFTKLATSLKTLKKSPKCIRSPLRQVNAPEHIERFVSDTFKTFTKPTSYVASYFHFGREDPIPKMFSSILGSVNDVHTSKKLYWFKLYMDRHVQLDADEHGPASLQLVLSLCKTDEDIENVIRSGVDAIQSRIRFWDGICKEIEQRKQN